MPVSADGGRGGAAGSMTAFVAVDVGRRLRLDSPSTVASTKSRGGHDGGQKEQKPSELDELPADRLLPVNQHRESQLAGYFARNDISRYHLRFPCWQRDRVSKEQAEKKEQVG
jgi:hypothetical protein